MSAVFLNNQCADLSSDDWRTTTTVEYLKSRARLLQNTRTFFEMRDVLEVETPLLSEATTSDPNLHSLTTQYTGAGYPHGKKFYLQTSPEFAMKRLLACGSGSIFQVCKAFRDGEAGRLHNPEFTLLEWYRIGYDYQMLMDEVEEYVATMLAITTEFERLTYQQAFERYTGINPHDASVELLQNCASHDVNIQVNGLSHLDRDGWLDCIMSHLIEPHLGHGCPTFIYDYPASKAALAAIRNENPALAERFELYVEGIELANGFRELANQPEQTLRVEQDREKRLNRKLPDVKPDRRLLAALEYGLPSCAGVAVGLDRLLMIKHKVDFISEILAFPVDRA